MWSSVAVVFVFLVAVGGLIRLTGYRTRKVALQSISEEEVLQASRGVSMRVVVRGAALPGMKPGRQNRTTADMLRTADRFIIASNRGKLVDIKPGSRKLTSVRCTGPSRLVIEGSTPTGRGDPAAYRFEVFIDTAESWTQNLQPFCEPSTQQIGRHS